MREHNWLYNYQFAWGVEKSFEGVVHRAKYLVESDSAVKLLKNNYYEFENSYNVFFPELRTFSLKKFSDIH